MKYFEENQNRFAPAILERGKDYAKQGLVHIQKKTANSVSALVMGSEDYRVFIQFTEQGKMSSAICTCPYAKEGKHCKHMAAVLKTLEEEEDPNSEITTPNLAKKTLQDYKTAISSLSRFNAEAYVRSIQKLLPYYEDAFDKDELFEAERFSIAESVFHSGYAAYQSLGELAYAFYQKAGEKDKLEYGKEFFISLPCFEAKAMMLHEILHHEEDKKLLEALIENKCIQGKEWAALRNDFHDYNPFSFVPGSSLKTIAVFERLDNGVQDDFLAHCIEVEAEEAIDKMVQSGKLSLNRETLKTLQNYFYEHQKIDSYIRFMNTSIQNHEQRFHDVVVFYQSLPEENKKEEALFLRRVYAYSDVVYDIALLTESGSITLSEFQRIGMDTLCECTKQISAFGQDFYEKAIQKRFEKCLKSMENHKGDSGEFLDMMRLISAFSSSVVIRNFLFRPDIIAMSMGEPKYRLAYLKTVDPFLSSSNIRRF